MFHFEKEILLTPEAFNIWIYTVRRSSDSIFQKSDLTESVDWFLHWKQERTRKKDRQIVTYWYIPTK